MEGLEAVHEALRQMRREGVDRVYVEADTLSLLEAARPAVAESAPSAGGPAAAAPPAESAQGPAAVAPERPAERDRPSPPHGGPPIPEPPPVPEPPEGAAATRMAWLEARVLDCPVCRAQLGPEGRIVFGAGDPGADLFFCGEAPGADEERAGEPFVGKAGRLLTKIVAAMGLTRDQVYIANILKWRPRHDRPFGNRPPTAEEMRFCLPYLVAQLRIVRPKAIVALGNTAVTGLLGPDPKRRMAEVRGEWREFEGIPLMPTYHPAYLLRNNTDKSKREVWEDMLRVMEKTGLPVSEKQRGYFLPKG